MSDQFGQMPPDSTGAPNPPEQQQPPQYQQEQQYQQYSQDQQYQQSSQYYQQYPGYPQDVPQEIKKWNWGAFMFSIMWGIGNKTLIALLCLVPCLNVVFMFILGAKGNEWAWKANNYSDIATFKAVQETWNRAGFVAFWIFIAVMAIYIVVIAIVGASFLTVFRDGYGSLNNY